MTGNWNGPKDYKNFEEKFCLNRPRIQRVGKWIPSCFLLSLEVFCPLYRNQRKFFGCNGCNPFEQTRVQLKQAQLFRADTSVRRINTFIRPKRVVAKHAHPFGRSGRNHSKYTCPFANQTHPFQYHFQCWTKEFSLFLVPFISCSRPTSDLNISFIRKCNWTCEYTTFIANGRRTNYNHLPRIPSSGSRLKFNSNFPKNSLG